VIPACDAIDIFIWQGYNNPQELLLLTLSITFCFLYVPRVRISDRVFSNNKKKVFAPFIFTSEIGNKSEISWAQSMHDYFKIISGIAFIVTLKIEKLPKILRKRKLIPALIYS